ncbi:GntR family transcriptional regulator [Paenibacillus lutrae]|uniref:GntR family transcriptional regulator n=1 Tax=Paenibacillus lutrae TaxID=2078573 RepID=A0A7X3FLF2_9BACL|nr:GntR family transcriptional regulator [Paenibacillus lutrae]MVP01767.1 GntR family transcriptional regulator [Paenibacillus lutrae]
MLKINERSEAPIYEQIVQGMKELILKGALQPGDKLPSVREMSATLLVNPNTVAKAYQELERYGIIQTLRGKGTFVAETSAAPGMEKERLERLRHSFHQLLVEAGFLGIGPEQLQAWIDEFHKEIKE